MGIADVRSTALNAPSAQAYAGASTFHAPTAAARRKHEPSSDSDDLNKPPGQTSGNNVAPLLGGEAATDEVIKTLTGASSSIQVEMYRIGNEKILDLLKQKAKSGTVKVQVLLDPSPGYDAADTAEQKHIRDSLKAAGVELITYPIKTKDKIDHVKLLIVDGRKAVIGGLNWDKHSHSNLDIDVAIKGEAVAELSKVFAQDWKISGGGNTPGAGPAAPEDITGDARVRVATTEENSEGIRSMLVGHINNARKSIRMVAFALADKQVIEGLIDARKRGVDVKVLLDPNKPISYTNEKSKRILEAAGVEVRYLAVNVDVEEKAHAKAAAFDDDAMVLGSANFTDKGLTVNHEADVEIISKSVVPTVTNAFDKLWANRSVSTLPNLPDMEERASEEPYDEAVAHRLFGWYNETYHPGETHNWTGRGKAAIMDAMEHYSRTGGRAPDNASEAEQIGALAAFLTKRRIWDIKPAPASGLKVYEVRTEISRQSEQTVSRHEAEYKRKMIDMIGSPDLRDLDKKILDQAPEGFYKSPSSSTGKYHPADETRFADVKPRVQPPSDEELAKYPGGGLVLHSLRNTVLAAALCDYYEIQARARDEILVGESLHDICKFDSAEDIEKWQPGQPVPWGRYTTKDHAHAGAEFVKKIDPTGGSATETIRRYIDMHMGAWNAPKPTPPKDNAERIISLADYLASTSDYYVKV